MTLANLKKHLIFALESSLIDLITRQIPVYLRKTPVTIGADVNGNYRLETFESYHPIYQKNNAAFYIEEPGTNLVANNTDFNSNWIKGSNNVNVLPDVDASPKGTLRSDRIRWDRGIGIGQIFKRSFALSPDTTYIVQWGIALYDGEPGVNDVIQVSGDVVDNSEELSLGSLSDYPQKMRLLTHQFTTSGKNFTSEQIGSPSEQGTYTILSLTATTITVGQWEFNTNPDELISATLSLDIGDEGKTYRVVGNTAADVTNSQITFTVNGDLLADGITNTNTVSISGAAKQNVELEIYVESTLSLSLAFVDLKEGSFPTSPIIQNNITPTSGITWFYQNSPISGLKNFSIFLDIQEWRGDGTIVDLGNVLILIENQRLKVTVDVITFTVDIPKFDASILLSVSSEQRKIECYINNRLEKISILTTNVLGSLTASLLFGTKGVRIIRRVLFFNTAILADETEEEGSSGTKDVALVFTDQNIVNATDLSAVNALITPGLLTIPPKGGSSTKTKITAINSGTKTITVENASGISSGDSVSIARKLVRILEEVEEILFYRNVISVSSNNIVLDSVSGIKIDDVLISGDYESPGIASLRFPFEPIDLQVIEAIDADNKIITLSTVASFSLGTCYVRNSSFQEIAEIVVFEKDEANQTITVNDVTGIEVDHSIAQPDKELLIAPKNYFVTLTKEISGVSNPKKYINGVSFENWNNYPVTIEPIIQVNL